MPFALKLAWKYFRSARRGLVRFTSIVAVLGIAAGVSSLIIAQALADGFRYEMRSKILSNTAHIRVSNVGDGVISNWEFVAGKIRQIDGVERIEPAIYESAAISGMDRSSYALLRVIDWKVEPVRPNLSKKTASISISMGKALAEKLDLKTGDEAEILALGKGGLPTNSVVEIKGVFETGLYDFDSTWVNISRTNYEKLKESEALVPTVFQVNVTDEFESDSIAREIQSNLGFGYQVNDWQQANKPLFAALSLERTVSIAIISLIIFIAALNITTTLALLVNERRLDIAVLRTSGARIGSLVSVFIFEGAILSLFGVGSGIVIGLVGCAAGNYFEIVSLSKEVYSLSFVTLKPDFSTVFLISFFTILLCFGAIIYPAVKVSKIKPLENLRKQ